jgi:hypothetical protein
MPDLDEFTEEPQDDPLQIAGDIALDAIRGALRGYGIAVRRLLGRDHARERQEHGDGDAPARDRRARVRAWRASTRSRPS